MKRAYNEKERPKALFSLDLRNADGVLSFRTLANLESNLVTDAERVECYINELVGVEKEVLSHTLDLDEAESLVRKSGNSSFLHVIEYKLRTSSKYQTTGSSNEESTSYLE